MISNFLINNNILISTGFNYEKILQMTVNLNQNDDYLVTKEASNIVEMGDLVVF